MTWSVVVAAPKGAAGEQWGDTWFASDLVDALTRAGQTARVVFRGGATVEAREYDDVVVVLRGLRRFVPRRGNATWMLWVISHPELVEADEPSQYDAVFAASEHWSRSVTDEFGVPVTPLLQATNPHRFRPEAAEPDSGESMLFVGSTRSEYRPAVRHAIEAGLDLSVYGVGWEAYLPPEKIRGEFIANADLPAAYAGAGVVLNDHWPDMAAEGFLSNRLFDAAACGSRILTDEATGLADVFGDRRAHVLRSRRARGSPVGRSRGAVPRSCGSARAGRPGRARPQLRRPRRRAPRAGAGAPGPAMTPDVSVVVISYNDATRLPRAIRSVQRQTLRSLEIIVVDDASTDATADVVRRLAQDDPRIRYERLVENSGGCSAPRNRGMDLATAPWVMFCDSDDEYERHACKNLLETAERTGADVVCGTAERVDVRTGRVQALASRGARRTCAWPTASPIFPTCSTTRSR